jgi:hypothetical protein
MSRFFVGQRVRVVRSDFYPQFVGREAVITEGLHACIKRSTGMTYYCYTVDLDPGFGPTADQLEPILPSGHRPSEYTFTELMDRCRAGEVANV